MTNSSKIRQLLALLIVVSTLALAAAIALKAYRGMRSGPNLPSLPKNIDLSLQKIHYTETRGGVKRWDLLADKAEYDRTGEVVRLSGIRFDVAQAGKPGEIVLTAARGEYNTGTRNVLLIGNVMAKGASGMEFRTDRVVYVAAGAMLRTDDRVKYTDEKLSLEGTGMEFMVDKKLLMIKQQVEATYSVEKAHR